MTQAPAFPSGTDLRILMQNCQCAGDMLNDTSHALERLREAIRSVGFQDLSEAKHDFDGEGYTLAIILAESHVVIHTWPEYGNLVLADLSVCNYSRPNRERTLELGERLIELFQPTESLKEAASMIPRLVDKLILGHGYYVEIDRLVASRKSAFQEIVVADTPVFGRTLVIDGVFQTSEEDDVFYHEPLVHVPMLSHPEPERVLICGGGDGGAAREVLKHPSVQSCTIVDIDPEVIELSKTHLKTIHRGALHDERVEVVIEDAAQYIQAHRDSFDVILLDSTDPGGPANTLFTDTFYQDICNALAPDGYLGLHVGSPLVIEEISAEAVKRLESVYERCDPYLSYVPAYATQIGFLLCQRNNRPLPPQATIEERLQRREIVDLQIISPETFAASFAIPPRLRKRVFPQRGADVMV